MFTPSDPVSEIIAHFVGFLDLHVEEMRMRHIYEDFQHRAAMPDAPDLPLVQAPFEHQLSLRQYDPGVAYTPPGHEIDLDVSTGQFRHTAGIDGTYYAPEVDVPAPQWPAVFTQAQESGVTPLGAPPPGSTVLVVEQTMVLIDHDVVIAGNIAVNHAQALGDGGALADMLTQAEAAGGPVAAIEAPHAMETIAPYFEAMHAAIAEVAAGQGSDGQTLTVTHEVVSESGFTVETTTITGPSISGIYVDGVAQEAMPEFEDLLPGHMQAVLDDDTSSAPPEAVGVPDTEVVVDPTTMPTSTTVDAGGNLMVNEVTLVNAGLAATFVAVGGDYHSIDAIIQTNIFSDHDLTDPNFPGAANGTGSSTAAHNIANFGAVAVDNAASQQAANPGAFPTNWTVSVVSGDIVFVDWVKQFNFMSDSDTHVLTATGTTTTITTGENIGINAVSFADLGKYFDMVVVQGNLYDGNVISQINVLYDDDVVSWLGEGATGDTGSVDTTGSLLWNSASITNIGMGDVQAGLPDPYGDALASLGAAQYDMPESFSHEQMFEGFANLRILYVTGNVYDLHTITQVNVMGDSDLVAAYRDDVLDEIGDNWSIETGGNVLANIASIIDYDSMGSTAHIGGSIYSDAILIQANLIDAAAPEVPEGDRLATEVIAFLDIDMDSVTPDDDGPPMSLSDLPSGDALHSMLG